MKEWENEKDPQIRATLEKAWLYSKMADDLRAQAAQAIYQRDHLHAKPSRKVHG
jgi:hypothetical protein